MNVTPKSFLRWAGGKRWLAEDLAPFFKECRGTYYEPFLGSGSMFFAADPKSAVLSDINSELINLYKVVQKNPSDLRDRLSAIEVTKKNYYIVRSAIHSHELSAAARTLFLNKTGFNGLYRVNKRGEFNVPFGDRGTDDFLRTNVLETSSLALKRATLLNKDFEVVIDRADCGDMIYCDPAYTVKHDNNGFLRYNESVFSWADQTRLRNASIKAARRGATIVVSNAAHPTIAELYRPYKPLLVFRRSAIGNIGSRGQVVESVFVLSQRSSDRQRVKKLLHRFLASDSVEEF